MYIIPLHPFLGFSAPQHLHFSYDPIKTLKHPVNTKKNKIFFF